MPLPYADPTRSHSAVGRAATKLFRSPAGQAFIKNVAAKTDPWLDRITNGRLNWGLGVVPTATLKSTGAKTGQPREVQVTYFHDGPDPIVIASNYGGNTNPQWARNLIAHPDCELGGHAFRATEVSDPDEYARLYGLAERVYAGYADYKAKADLVGRHIPIFRLTAR
jgi:deazaflavin-dependent oxidoreductase (nitroreductase family)